MEDTSTATASPEGSQPVHKAPLFTRDFVLVTVDNLVFFICYHILMSTMPLYVKELGGNNIMVGLVAILFTVSSLVTRPLTGRWLDTKGRRGIWLLGAVAFILVILGYNWALTIPVLLLLRVIHGMCWGVIATSLPTAATDLIPPARRGEGMGYFGIGINLGMAIGPALGIYLIINSGFNALFWTAALFALAALVLITLIKLPKFTATQEIRSRALLEPSAIKPAMLLFFGTFALGGIITYIALYGAEHNIANPGIFFTVYAFAVILARPTSGALFDRRGHKPVLVSGFILMGTGMLVLGFASNMAMFMVAAVFCGLGFGSLLPALQALSVRHCAPNRRGAAQATYTMSFDMGIGVGSMALGAIAQMIGYHGMYFFAGGVVFAGLAVYLATGIKSPDAEKSGTNTGGI